MSLSEFDLIDKYFRNALKDGPEVKCGIGDDAALVSVPAGMELAVSVDTLVAGIHFPIDTSAADIGYKSLAVNLSDMAAMGADPQWITMSLTMPENNEDWLQSFMSEFAGLAKQYSLSLIGGDLSQGPLSITVQIHGFIPQGKALYRRGAQAGDLVYVTGTLGDAGLALGLVQGKYEVAEKYREYLMNRLNRPTPQIELGMALREIASSAIDISDGLLADLDHIAKASHKGAIIDIDNLPLSEAVRLQPDAIDIALTSGDDYELCFTVSPEKLSQMEELKQKSRLSCIGKITEGEGVVWQHADGSAYHPKKKAWQHF
jgi:thiamine-monophosphate kinase